MSGNVTVLSRLVDDDGSYDISDEAFIEALAKAEENHFWFRSRARHVVDSLQRAGCEPGSSILDVGCGRGALTAVLNGAGYLACGVEGHETLAMVAARRSPAAEFFVQNLSLGLDPSLVGTYGCATLFDVLEHLDEPAEALRQAVRVVVPGGVIAGTVPALMSLWSEVDAASGHRTRYDRRQMLELLEGVPGLDIIEVSYFNALLVAPLWARRRFSKQAATTREAHLKQPPRWLDQLAYRVLLAESKAGLVLRAAKLPGASLWFAACVTSSAGVAS